MAPSRQRVMKRPGSGVGLFVAMMLSAACSGGTSSVVFESVDAQTVKCPQPARVGVDCVLVTAPVVGEGNGHGRCVVYATSGGQNVLTAADSGELEIAAGKSMEWEVEVQRPVDREFTGWNPVCSPMIEG